MARHKKKVVELKTKSISKDKSIVSLSLVKGSFSELEKAYRDRNLTEVNLLNELNRKGLIKKFI